MYFYNCEVNTDHLRHLRCLFFCFEVVLELKINLAKAQLVHVGSVEDVGGLARILGCKVSSAYEVSGSSFGGFFQGKMNMGGIIEKMEHRLARWKQLYLFFFFLLSNCNSIQ